MLERELSELYQWKKQQMMKLMEIADLTDQLSQAVERRDEVSVDMLLNMREDPIRQVQELEKRIQEHLRTLPPEEAARLSELLKGEPAQGPEEEKLSAQVLQDRRLLERIQKADNQTSVRLGGKRSFYQRS